MEAVIITFKYIELFAGVGGFRQALDPLGGKCVFASEIDKYASQAYRALYNGAPELHGDITKIDANDVPDHDVLVGGFPCQAFSVAGQRKGFEDTRGTLFFEIARIASAKQPRLMLLENVKGLLSHDGGNTFETMCAVLNDIGYAIDFNVLNSKYFGVPQNRERIFIVCSRDAEHAEWDVKGNDVVAKAKRRAQELGIRTFNFEWPAQGKVTTRLRDILESYVDERYYLSEEKTAKLIAQLNERRDSTEPIVHGSLNHYGNDPMNRIYSVDGVAPTITVVSGGGREQKIAVEIEKVGHLPSDSGQTGAVYGADGIAPTLLNQHGNAVTKIATVWMNRERISHESDVSHCLMARDHKGYGNQDMAGIIEVKPDWIPGPDDINRTVRTSGKSSLDYKHNCDYIAEEVRPVLTPDREEKRQNGRRFKDDGEESFTLTAQDKHGIAIGTYPRYRIRKLTPRECWRLQAFTDAQHDAVAAAGISDSQRYKQAGNAVTVSVISAIGKRMISLLSKEVDA